MKICTIATLLLVIGGLHARAEEQVLPAQAHTGTLSFDPIPNAAPGTQVTGYRVEWAHDQDESWQAFGVDDLDYIPADGTDRITAVVPAFYRVEAKMLEYLIVDMTGGISAYLHTTNRFPMSTRPDVPPSGWTDEHKTTHMVFRLIPPGTYMIGSPPGELGRDTDEIQHEVTITRPFYIGIFPVTQKQWELLMGNWEPDAWPSHFSNETYRDTRPVEQVSYRKLRGGSAGELWPQLSVVEMSVDNFMNRMQRYTGRHVDLPTEAQWEYAARAGTSTALNSGFDLTDADEDPRMDEVGRYSYNGGDDDDADVDTSGGTAAVGSYLPNAWGLYDMHGNVWEWCLDWYGAYPETAVTDPKGAASGSARVLRGGSYADGADFCRSAIRNLASPTDEFSNVGFRVVLSID